MMTMIVAVGEGIGRRPAAAVPTRSLRLNETPHAAVTLIAAVRIATGIAGTVRKINVLERAGAERAHGGVVEITTGGVERCGISVPLVPEA